MTTNIRTALLALHARLGTGLLLLLSIAGLYALYVIKMKLGIDIFPDWGLHLPGPKGLLRHVVQAFDLL